MIKITLPKDDEGQTRTRVLIILGLTGYDIAKSLSPEDFEKEFQSLFQKYHKKTKLPIKQIVAQLKKKKIFIKEKKNGKQ